MHIRRQLLAAGLFVAALLAPPGTAGRSSAHAQAAQPFSHTQTALELGPIYLPLVASQIDAPDLSVRAVQVVQGVAMSPGYTTLVAGRPALVRVFVEVSGGAQADGVTARLTHYVAGAAQGTLSAGPLALVAGSAIEGNLSQTFNFSLPAEWTTDDSAYVVELDPGRLVPESNEGNNRYPVSGEQPYHFLSQPVLEVVIVPVEYRRPGGTATLPPLDDLTYLTWMPAKVLPVAHIQYSVRPTPLLFTGDLRTAAGWGELLASVDAVRAAEDPTWNKLYYGLVDSAASGDCGGGCYTGLGYVNSPEYTVYKTSIGFAGFVGDPNQASVTFTHEMGHNFGRRHAPCAGPPNVDTAYPYTGAAIGQWGYDLDTGALISPGTKDYMSYCGPAWTSDYTYFGIAQAWSWLNRPLGSASHSAGEQLVFSGYRAPDGTWTVEPVFAGDVPAGPSSVAARYSLELLDHGQAVLGRVPFALAELALDTASGDEQAVHTAPPARFRLAVDTPPGLAGFRIYEGDDLVYERIAQGTAPSLPAASEVLGAGGDLFQKFSGMAAASHYRVRFSPDGGKSWILLVPEAASPEVAISPALLDSAATPLIDVQVSDGVRIDRQTYALAGP